jgi:hypothetical protein
MNDDKNANETAQLSELFDGQTDASSSAPASAAPTTTKVLPEAEPAWLHGRDAAQRSTPRIRWAGIVWGLVFAAAGWFAVWTLLSAERRAAFAEWILTLDNGGWAVVAAFTVGGLLLVLGLVAALRAATRQP